MASPQIAALARRLRWRKTTNVAKVERFSLTTKHASKLFDTKKQDESSESTPEPFSHH
jgi:hypothetical protein